MNQSTNTEAAVKATPRERRITLRFYMDDPIASETYDSLMRRRSATGSVMNTLIVGLLHRELCQENDLSLDELEKLFRSIIRSEGRSLLREWCAAVPAKTVTESRVDSTQDEYLTNDDDEDDDDSLDMTAAFCGNLA